MNLGAILLIILVILVLTAAPVWPHSASWGYWPSGTLGVILLVVLVLAAAGRL